MGKAAKRRAAAAAPAAADPAPWIARATLAAGLLAVALVVDSGADASFDSPKRLLASLAIGIAALAAFGFPPREMRALPWRAAPLAPRIALFLWVAALVIAFLSALLSPRREVALDAFRAILLFGLALPLGASRALERPAPLAFALLAGAAVNAAVSLLQASGLFSPFRLRVFGGREATGAFAGNVGYLTLSLALAAIVAADVLAGHGRKALRLAAGAGLLLFLAAIVANQNLTSLTALAAGLGVLFLRKLKRRVLLPAALGIGLLVAGVALYPPLRQRAAEAREALRSRDWDRLSTYRLGPWAAALEMVRERPLLGFGPGTFGAEFVPHRLRAETRARQRFVNPLVTSSYAEAHSDWLQPFAEIGLPGGVAVTGAALMLLVALWRATRGLQGSRREEAMALLALLVAGAVAALAWFPMQRAITALPLLLAAGRAWRLSAEAAP